MGKKSSYSRSDVKPLSFYCTINNEVVFKAETWNNFEFNSPKDGTFACGEGRPELTLHQYTSKSMNPPILGKG